MFYCIFSIKVYCIHFIRHTECFLFQMKEKKNFKYEFIYTANGFFSFINGDE